MQPECKQCEVCGVTFTRPAGRSQAQWDRMRFHSTGCANAWRARTHNPMSDADVRYTHGQKVAAGIAASSWWQQKRHAKAQRVAEQQARGRHRHEVAELRRMLQQVERLAHVVAQPCSCQACRDARARAGRRATRDARKGLVLELKGRTCQGCGGTFEPERLHFHHLDPSTKRFNLSRGTSWQYSPIEIVEEARKCIVLCADCHMAVHSGTTTVDSIQLQFDGG